MFCPLVRGFLNFDNGEKLNPKSARGGPPLQTSILQPYGGASFWKQNPSESAEAAGPKAKDGEGLLSLINLKRSFYFGDIMDDQQSPPANPYEEQFGRPSVDAHLNCDFPLIKSDYMPGETEKTEEPNRATLNGSAAGHKPLSMLLGQEFDQNAPVYERVPEEDRGSFQQHLTAYVGSAGPF